MVSTDSIITVFFVPKTYIPWMYNLVGNSILCCEWRFIQRWISWKSRHKKVLNFDYFNIYGYVATPSSSNWKGHFFLRFYMVKQSEMSRDILYCLMSMDCFLLHEEQFSQIFHCLQSSLVFNLRCFIGIHQVLNNMVRKYTSWDPT